MVKPGQPVATNYQPPTSMFSRASRGAPDTLRRRTLSRRHAVRSSGAHCVRGRVPAAQGALRSVGNGATGTPALSRRTCRRSRRRARPARLRSCCCSTTRRRTPLWSTGYCRRRAQDCTRHSSERGRGCRAASLSSPARSMTSRLLQTDVVVSSHACGALTDRILARAATARVRVAVLPCCHDLDTATAVDLGGWLDGPVAIDVVRATRLAQDRAIASGRRAIPAEDHAEEPIADGRSSLAGRW